MVDKKSTHSRSIERWGEGMQMVVTVEECAELIKAVTKIQRGGATRGRLLDLVDEMSDVQLSQDFTRQFMEIRRA